MMNYVLAFNLDFCVNLSLLFSEPFHSQMQLLILLDACHKIHCLVYIILYSHHMSALYCIDIVRRDSVLVTRGVKGLICFFD